MEWISINDEVPGNEVLAVSTKNKEYLIGYISKTMYGAFQAENDHETLEYVTHWMPLPPLPNK